MKFSDRGATIDVNLRLENGTKLELSVKSTGFEAAPLPPGSIQVILVTVEDTGIGLSDDAKMNIFQTTTQVRDSGGTGLGLYSLAKRIEALGGKYGVRNRSDGRHGALFWFTFPYQPDNVPSVRSGTPAGSRGRKVRPLTAVIPPLRVLLVDDSSAILKITGRFLKANGHTVETADNGYQCLERLKKGRTDFDVLITDLQMPVMDGFTSVREYRAWEKGYIRASDAECLAKGEGDKKRRLYIIGMSANGDDESVKDALAAGMDDFVTKPFNYEILATSLKGALLVSSRR